MFGETTAPPPSPVTKRAGTSHGHTGSRPIATRATTRTPAIITSSAPTVSRRPTSETNRPATGAAIAEPAANGISSRPASSGECPRPSWR